MVDIGVMPAWQVALLCGLATYLWRGLGVMFSGAIRTESPIFVWVGCVAYAMIAGLIVRILLMPSGTLMQTLLTDRLLACVAAAMVFFLGGRNLFYGVITGGTVLVVLNWVREAAA